MLHTTNTTNSLNWTDGLGSFAAVCAKYLGHISNWTHVLPSTMQSVEAFNNLPPDLKSKLAARAAKHGLEGWELMQKVPQVLWDDHTALSKWLELFDVSHVVATSIDPSAADDPTNWTWELSGVNRSRQADTMTGAEYRTANETAHELAGSPWWEFNNLLRAFMDIASVCGYTAVWLPKSTWSSIMNGLSQLYVDLKNASTFGLKLKVARVFANRIVDYTRRHGNPLIAAFLLGMLTFMWPPAQWFVAAWAMTGLLCIATSVLRKACHYGMGNSYVKAIAELFNVPLRKLFEITSRSRQFLEVIKQGIFLSATKCVDFFFVSFKKVAEVVKPHIVATIKKTVKTVVEASKKAITGFINWIGTFFGGSSTAAA